MTDRQPRRIAVVFAHPDDAEFTCSGSLARWIAEGDEVTYIVCTSGDKGTHDREMNPAQLILTREQEQQAAAQELGVKQVIFLRHKDGEVEPTMALRAELALVLRQCKPEVVITHDPWLRYAIHPDHRAVGVVTMDAVVAARDHLYFHYQLNGCLDAQRAKEILLFSPEEPNFWVDITGTFPKKMAALQKHASQLVRAVNLEKRMRQRAADIGKPQGIELAEAFRQIELR
ncbi:MAG: PIG-L family deacetylase [Bacteroidetes bacterium]|nr:PIG-L family deacetylase [Bacteroidota bacterium]MCL5026655.1 PIG-L family deacetylase [Chloroflexota bacterium]